MNLSISDKIPGTAILAKVVKIFAFAFACLFLSATAMAEIPLPQKHHVTVPPTPPAPALGSWQMKAGPPDVYLSAPLLLSDGTVIFHNFGASDWWKLTPDNTGNYVYGAWSQIASLPSNYGPTYYASAVLPDGKVVISGGEYNVSHLAETNLGAIYDPDANTWTTLPGWTGSVGDAQSVVLPSSQFMIGSCCVAGQALLNESTLTWTPTGSGKADSDSEESLNLLPNGLVLTVDTQDCNNTELYNPFSGTWADTGMTTVGCGGGQEMGPAVLRADGTVVQFGAVTSGADPVSIYNVASGVWAPAPNVPNINGTFYTLADAPAAMMPNGNILFAASPGLYSNPTHYWEFDGTNYTQAPDTLGASSDSSFYINFLVLPNGQVLATDFSDAVAFYTPSSPQSQPAPTVSSVPTTLVLGTSYTLTGTQLGGLTNGANYGDDYQSSTNYPIIAVVNNATGHVFYAETYDWTVSVAPRAPGSTNFILPIAEAGASQLFVIANGVQSSPVSVTAAGISPDGSTISAGSGGSLVTSAGIWTFGPCCDPYGQGQYKILLNKGTAWSAGQGYALKMEVANGGKLYTYNSVANAWWTWSGTAWAQSSGPGNTLSSDGTIITAPMGSLVTTAGTWTFGSTLDPYVTDPI